MAQVSSGSSSSLVRELNDLLLYLDVPLTLRSPTDLTPSLILALLESILQQRLPEISTDVRTCRTEEARVICVKMVLGILQTDILAGTEEQMVSALDLTGVDPERLARGGEEEVTRVAKVLCWLGRKIMTAEQAVQHVQQGPAHRQRSSSSSCATAPKCSRRSTAFSKTSSSSTRRRAATDPNASIEDSGVGNILPHLSSFEDIRSRSQLHGRPRQPRRDHEIRSPNSGTEHSFREDSFLVHADNSNSSSSSFILAPVAIPPVRQHGYIGEVDEDAELDSFETSRIEMDEKSHGEVYGTHRHLLDLEVDFEDAGHARTISLLKERARLLYRIAKLQQEPSGNTSRKSQLDET
ncbi:hypothetical protein PM082_008848 [Marasmius tenuissimus]|nr:hypothetical protein PM082_008848 [Marasmius tenuissimus]